MFEIFIDGSAGTTGLQIYDRLKKRDDLKVITLPQESEQDTEMRREALNHCDIAFLCLPDVAAKEAVAMTTNPDTVIIDASTAHRTSPGWVYGFPEIGDRRKQIAGSKRIANPGCHAGGFISLIAPLVEKGFLNPDIRLACTSITGYSGGGKNMIAQYEDKDRAPLLDAPRLYGLSQHHKHLPEMRIISGLKYNPVFAPIVAPFYSGMEVMVPLFIKDLNGSYEDVINLYEGYYDKGMVTFKKDVSEGGFLSAGILSRTDHMEITVTGNEERIILCSRFDNLGKGASGSAIQNMNIVLGIEETTGLV